MKKNMVLLSIFVMLSSITSLFAADELKLGEKLTLTDTTKISKILENPEGFVDKRLLVQGTILDVCEKRGCWINIASDKPFQKIRIKVKDGEIVFPMSAKGKTAIVEGVVQKFELTKEQRMEQAKHQAEERGTEFDPSSIKGPETIYQIKGIGAVILDD